MELHHGPEPIVRGLRGYDALARERWRLATSDITIKVTENGPYEVTGPVTILDPEGDPYPPRDGELSLCRCGHSERKPFCDGSHERVGFQSVVLADDRT